MIKQRLILAVCTLCMFAALLFSLGFAGGAKADEIAPADTVYAIRKDNGNTVPIGLSLEWEYGAEDIISHAFRPEHGDTVYYTLYSKVTGVGDVSVGEALERFAVVYIGDTAVFLEVDGDVVSETSFKVQSLNAYLSTLKAGSYSLNVRAPGGIASDGHTHWWDGSSDCDITTYQEATLEISLTVNAYELTEDNIGDSNSEKPVKYKVQSPNVVTYTGKADNLPEIEFTFNGTALVKGEDYLISSPTVNVVDDTKLVITGIGGFTGEVTITNAYKIVKAENSVDDVYVVRWRYGEYDRNVNRLTANVKWGEDKLYFAVSTDATGENVVDGLGEISLEDGVVSNEVAQLLNKLDAKKTYYLHAIQDGDNNYFSASDYTQFEVAEVINTWTTTPSVVGWEWRGFDENVNVINAAPAFGDSVKFAIYVKDGDKYTALMFGEEKSFELEDGKLPAAVIKKLSSLDAGTYYLFASVASDTDNYTSINKDFNTSALVPFRVSQARNYWKQLPKISNWAYGEYNPEINFISATAAHGSSNIKYRVYKQSGDGFGLLDFNGTTSFFVNAQGALPTSVNDGLKVLGVGKYYLRAEVASTNNYTGLQETVTDFSQLPMFEVIKADNYWTTAPTITTWAEGKYSNEENMPVAAAYFGAARIVIVDVNDIENVIYDSENNINELSKAKVGAYLLTATVAGTDNYDALTFDTIFHVFVPETATIGMAWWLVLIIVICSLGLLVFIFWLLHDKGVLQMLTSKTIVAMRTKATMDATIAAIRANKLAEEAKESVRRAEELEKLEAEKTEIEENDSDEGDEAILIDQDEQTGVATFVRYQRSFSVKLIQTTDEAKERYSYLKNILLSYKKVKSKISNGYDAFNCGRKQLAKLAIRGKTICLYLALNPDEYADTKYKTERSVSMKFEATPCLFRVKSQRGLKYAEELIAQLCEKSEIAQGEVGSVDYRPPYESTEQLLKKGLIKKITYTQKVGVAANKNQYGNVSDNTDDEVKPTQTDAVSGVSDVDDESVKNEEESVKSAAPEGSTVASDDISSPDDSSGGGSKNSTNKKTSRSKKNVAKK